MSRSREQGFPDLFDPEENQLALDERSERIGAMLDLAFEQGYEEQSALLDRDVRAHSLFQHERLIDAFKAGWDTAALDERVAKEEAPRCGL